jgi:hypothetical protein
MRERFDDQQRDGEHDARERERWTEAGHRDRAGVPREEQKRAHVGGATHRQQRENAAHRRLDRTRKRHRREGRGGEVTGDGDEMGDRDHGGCPNLTHGTA